VVITVFVPILATFFAIWRLWGHLIGGTELALFLGFYVAAGLGASIGFHRMLTHSSFECGPVVKASFLILGSMAGQGRCIEWAAHHRKHHAYSDREGDPHSPLDGFVHAYFGWILRGPAAERERYCKRLLEDRLVSFIDRTTALWLLLGLAIPFAAAGWSGLLWGGFVRMAFFSQIAYSVNSFGHTFGSRPFDTKDESRNNWILAVLGFGDGWHNNHHAFPSMAYHGMRLHELDPSALVIRLLASLRLVWNVKQPPATVVERRRRAKVLAEADR
jgi:stearoyl-CoA desaturase (delta-9 desaturase)